MGPLLLLVDVAERCAVTAVVALSATEWWGEPEPGSDGVPVGWFVPVLVAYAA